MTKNIYALLVGIDTYHPQSVTNISSLQGCVNDIEAVESYLRERIEKERWNLKPLILKNKDATRENIINAFQQHLCQANNEDVALFYYAGHGSQEKTPLEFRHLEPDGLHQSLVCYDSRTKNAWDLADKELGYLISKVAQKNSHILVIMDCCHSGTGTRDPKIRVRQTEMNLRERHFDSFIFAKDKAAFKENLTVSNLGNQTNNLTLVKGKHVAIAACRSDQTAKEYNAEGKPRGAFSYFLLQTIERTNGSLSYRDLVRNVNALVSGKVKEQSPQIETANEELGKPFLGGAIAERPSYFTLTYSNNQRSWVIDGGALHGIVKSSQGGDTLLAIFEVGRTPEQLRQLSNALGEARVTEVTSKQSKVAITMGSERLSQSSYWAVVTSLPLKPLKVYIQSEPGEEIGVQKALYQLNASAPGGKPSLFVQQVGKLENADYILSARKGQYWITQPTNDCSLIAPIPEKPDERGYTEERADKVIQRLEHIARWTNVLELESPANSEIKPDDVEIEIFILDGKESASSDSEKRLEYTYATGQWYPPNIQITLRNRSLKTLYCNIINLECNFAISADFFEEKSCIRLKPATESGSERIIEGAVEIPEIYLKQRVTECKDIFKLIVSTSEFDASLLEQNELDVLPRLSRSVELNSGTLNKLMAQVYTRKFVSNNHGKYDDWMTKQVTLNIIYPCR